MRIIHITGLVMLLLLGASSYSQEVKVNARLDTGAMLIGDHVGLKLRFEGPSGSHVIWPAFNDTILGNIIVIGRSKVDSSYSKDRKSLTLTQELNLTCFDTGFYTIPQIPFRYRIFPDTTLQTSSTGLSLLMVHTVKVDTTNVIKPIKGPLNIPITFLEVLPYILISLAALAIVLLIIWYVRRRKKNEPLIRLRPKVKLLPHEKALQDLEKLRTRKLWQQGNVKEYHSELTGILRTYIEEGYAVPALESTTYEIVEALKAQGEFAKPLLEKLDRVLQTADMVKFAKALPGPQENENALNTGIEIVNLSVRTVALQHHDNTTNQINQKPQA